MKKLRIVLKEVLKYLPALNANIVIGNPNL